tara:strand:- start:677 stop:2968 length:2292 start_codon:yes stop_codon:yes gene_type:complete
MDKIKISDIKNELENRFLTYALSTIVSRSLPDVRDGLKPIHRRILYAMSGMGLVGTVRHVKSAKIIGEVLGKYHPHGDASTYESMVRMAQDFSMRYPLLDGKGNFGSLDGDAPAAYRYTEGRLTPIAAFLLTDLKKDTVKFQTNYDNTLIEPVVLPSRLPNLLINGASGIAVGMACSFPPHNLNEILSALSTLIANPNQSTKNLMKYIKGPDFPTGGIILNSKKDICNFYEQGTGAIKIRSEWDTEILPRGKNMIIITSIPYGVNKAKIIERIAEIIITKKIPALVDVRDESDHRIRVVMELKNGSQPDKIMAYLFKHTDLEYNFQLNFTCLKPNGQPAKLTLVDLCRHFLDFRKDVVTSKFHHELELLEKRLHTLEAFAIIFSNLDKTLKLIRSSNKKSEAHIKLQKAFKFDNDQINAILEIPLYRLVSMEIDKILNEKKEKTKEKKQIKIILKSPTKIWAEVKSELEEIGKEFGDKRKTKIKTVEQIEINEEDFIEDQTTFIVLSKNGWIRKFKSEIDPDGLKFRDNDHLLSIVQANAKDLIAIFTSFGMCYVQRAFSFQYTRGGFGEPIQNLFKFKDGEKALQLISFNPNEITKDPTKESLTPEKKSKQTLLNFRTNQTLEALVASDSGYGFRFSLSNLSETNKSGRKIITIKEGEKMTGFSLVKTDRVFIVTDVGKGVMIPLDQIGNLSSAGRGVKLMNVGKGKLIGLVSANLKDNATLQFEDGSKRQISLKDIPVYNRGSMGITISKRKKINTIRLIS